MKTDTPRTDACPICGATDDCMCFSGELKQELAASKAKVEKLYRELAEARSLIIESKKMHDYIRKLLSFVYMELPAHDNTKKFVHQYFNEIQS